MPQIISLQAVPSQTVTVSLNNQACLINVRQLSTGVYLDLYVEDEPIVTNCICQDLNPCVRFSYLGFVGDLAFYDTQPNPVPTDPVWTGIGSRYVLEYFLPAEIDYGLLA